MYAAIELAAFARDCRNAPLPSPHSFTQTDVAWVWERPDDAQAARSFLRAAVLRGDSY